MHRRIIGLRRLDHGIYRVAPLATGHTAISPSIIREYATATEEKKPQFAPSKNLGFIPRGAPNFEWNHIHETDPSKGKILRVFYHNGSVHFHYLPQAKTRGELRTAEKSADESSTGGPAIQLCDRTKRVTLILPTPFICRLLAVLEGTQKSAELATRNTQGTFSGDYDAYTFDMSCTTVLPDGTSMSWKVEFKPGESVVLHRFLSLSLEKNFGFSAYTDPNPARPPNKRK
mmetsp:Transcript_33671/g.52636  ORF Transcript_33671/g.52636 Transcript_33671/m.52636 type:complete len:230 (-) Transcript_33671:49-738(-)